ncbi:hypothetical protein HHI36_008642 [Cryptolaemus montrouzieri]|uniref:Uncharacterized protein n=1 Tax=Cryptolaemus montrouzieri TaxID=559131 RepID=A0ABD2MT72_9CUCU
MRGFVLVICLVAAISSATCTIQSEDVSSRLRLKYLQAYLQERQAISELGDKVEEVCPGSKTKIEDAIDELKSCADKIDQTQETSCSIAKNRLPKCMEPIIKVVRDCMPAESKGLPDFFMKSVLKGVEYICKTDGEHIFELGNMCLYKQNPTSMTCKRKFQMRMQTYQRNGGGIGVEDVCSMMDYMKPCLKSHLSLSCGSTITQEAVLGIYEAFMSNCRTVVNKSHNELEYKTNDVEVNRLEDFS